MKFKKPLIIVLISILLVTSVFAWSYVKRGNVFVVTLDTGKVVNVTNITYIPSTKYVSAVIVAKNLTIQDAVNIKQIIQNISDNAGGKKNYSINVIIQNR